MSGRSLVAGPFHQSFAELVYSEIWKKILKELPDSNGNKKIEIHVNPKELNYAIGYKACNRRMLQEKYKQVKFKENKMLEGRQYDAVHN